MQLLTLLIALAVVGDTAMALAPKILVLGGTGFIGSTVSRIAVDSGCEVTSLSRRGTPSPDSDPLPGVNFLKGDATDPAVVRQVINDGKCDYDGVVHAVGMLFAGSLNRFASGSGSVPDPGTTYDKITRQTAFAATAALDALAQGGSQQRPFVFISAAEAKWGFDGIFEGSPVGFLHDYLVAKRAVEDELLNNKPSLRGVVLRPSLVWTKRRPGALLPVAAFQIGSRLGLPFIDRPVHVETLASAAVEALFDSSVRGVQDWRGMEKLAGSYKANKARGAAGGTDGSIAEL
ncbi:unnamed protein product [Ectocarpus sp. CCAP 1310/34]|nr:unnamed protein product [Ectocarpus sp. CCAP 1310/34]